MRSTGKKIETILGPETDLDGTLAFKSSLRVDGGFSGKIHTDGVLVISPGAHIKADVRAGTVIIGGTVTGNVEARTRLEMLHTGKIFGNIRTAKLRIADGVIFEGNCEMIKNPESKPDLKS